MHTTQLWNSSTIIGMTNRPSAEPNHIWHTMYVKIKTKNVQKWNNSIGRAVRLNVGDIKLLKILTSFTCCCVSNVYYTTLSVHYPHLSLTLSVKIFLMKVAKYSKQKGRECQLINYILGSAKLAKIYQCRKRMNENNRVQDVLWVFRCLVMARVIRWIYFNFCKHSRIGELYWDKMCWWCNIFGAERWASRTSKIGAWRMKGIWLRMSRLMEMM